MPAAKQSTLGKLWHSDGGKTVKIAHYRREKTVGLGKRVEFPRKLLSFRGNSDDQILVPNSRLENSKYPAAASKNSPAYSATSTPLA